MLQALSAVAATRSEAAAALRAGANCYLTKPVKHLDLLATLQALTACDDEDDSA